MKKLIVLLLLLPALTFADPQPWMKKAKEPNELVLQFGSSGDCPFNSDQGRKIVSDVLTRSRIKSVKQELYESYYPPFLQVLVHCTKLDTNFYMFEIVIDFVGMARAHDDVVYKVRWGETFFGSSGQAKAQTVRDTLRANVEDVIADYLKANFDLGEDE